MSNQEQRSALIDVSTFFKQKRIEFARIPLLIIFNFCAACHHGHDTHDCETRICEKEGVLLLVWHAVRGVREIRSVRT